MKPQYWADDSITAALGHAASSGGRPHVIQEEQGRKQACAGSWLPREKERKGPNLPIKYTAPPPCDRVHEGTWSSLDSGMSCDRFAYRYFHMDGKSEVGGGQLSATSQC